MVPLRFGSYAAAPARQLNEDGDSSRARDESVARQVVGEVRSLLPSSVLGPVAIVTFAHLRRSGRKGDQGLGSPAHVRRNALEAMERDIREVRSHPLQDVHRLGPLKEHAPVRTDLGHEGAA